MIQTTDSRAATVASSSSGPAAALLALKACNASADDMKIEAFFKNSARLLLVAALSMTSSTSLAGAYWLGTVGEAGERGSASSASTRVADNSGLANLVIKTDKAMAEYLSLLSEENRLEAQRDMLAVASARYLAGADETAIARWAAIHGAFRVDGLEGLAERQVGSARTIVVGPSDFLVVVPSGDPGARREAIRAVDIQMMVTGTPPTRVRELEYTIMDGSVAVSVVRDGPGRDYYVPGQHGFVSYLIGSAGDLERALPAVDELTGAMWDESGKLRLEGRDWPEVPSLITTADWAAMAEVYRLGRGVTDDERFVRPGFSLDPLLDMAALRTQLDDMIEGMREPLARLETAVTGDLAEGADGAAGADVEGAGGVSKVGANSDDQDSEDEMRGFIEMWKAKQAKYLESLKEGIHKLTVLRDAIPAAEPGAELVDARDWRMSAFWQGLDELRTSALENEDRASGYLASVVDGAVQSASDHSVARYDGGVRSWATPTGGVLSNTAIGRTCFYIDYLAKRAASHGTPMTRSAGLNSFPLVRQGFLKSRLAELQGSFTGRLWLEPATGAFTVHSDGVRFGVDAVRLFMARSVGGANSREEVEIPADLESWRAGFERRCRQMADGEPQLARFREIMKLFALFETANVLDQAGGSIYSKRLDVVGLDKIDFRLGGQMGVEWLLANDAQGVRDVIEFDLRGKPGAEIIVRNDKEIAEIDVFGLGLPTGQFYGVGNVDAAKVAQRQLSSTSVPQSHLELGARTNVDLKASTEAVLAIGGNRVTLSNGPSSTFEVPFDASRDMPGRLLAGPNVELLPDWEMHAIEGKQGLTRTARAHWDPQQKLLRVTDELGYADRNLDPYGVEMRRTDNVVTVSLIDDGPVSGWLAARRFQMGINRLGKEQIEVAKDGEDFLVGRAIAVHPHFGDFSAGAPLVEGSEIVARVADGPSTYVSVERIPANTDVGRRLAQVIKTGRVVTDEEGFNLFLSDRFVASTKNGKIMLRRGDGGGGADASLEEFSDFGERGSFFGRRVAQVDARDLNPEDFADVIRTFEQEGLTPVLKLEAEASDARLLTMYDTKAPVRISADERSLVGPRNNGHVKDEQIAEWLDAMKANPGDAEGVRVEIIASEAELGVAWFYDQVARAKRGEFKGVTLVVIQCAQHPQLLKELALAAMENGARSVVLPMQDLTIQTMPVVIGLARSGLRKGELPADALGAAYEEGIWLIDDLLRFGPAERAEELKKLGDALDPSAVQYLLKLTDEQLKALRSDLEKERGAFGQFGLRVPEAEGERASLALAASFSATAVVMILS